MKLTARQARHAKAFDLWYEGYLLDKEGHSYGETATYGERAAIHLDDMIAAVKRGGKM